MNDKRYYLSDYVDNVDRERPKHEWLTPEVVKGMDNIVADIVADCWKSDLKTVLDALGQLRRA